MKVTKEIKEVRAGNCGLKKHSICRHNGGK